MTSRIAIAVATAALGASMVTSAHAADELPTPSPADIAAATRAVQTEGLSLAAQVAEQAANQPAPAPSESAAPQVKGFGAARAETRSQAKDTGSGDDAVVVVPGTTTVVRTLSPRFVATGHGPVAQVSYVSTSARAKGRTVSVWAAKTGKGWEAVNAASGDVEAQMADAANGAPIFTEPQVNAWYALDGDTVRPLNDAAREAVGDGMSVADYQRVVHKRYAGMQRGSSYDRHGMSGGFAAQPKTVAAAPASASTPATSAPAGLWAAVGAASVAAIGGVLLMRRRARA